MRARVLLVPLVVAAAFLAGCANATPGTDPTPTPTTNGIEALTADEILAKSTEALNKATSYRVTGSAEEEGTKATIDLTVAGKNVKGTIKAEGMEIEVVQVDGQTFLKADALWESLLGAFVQDKAQLNLALTAIKGKYVKAPADDDSLSSFIPKPEELLKPEGGGAFTKGAVTTIDGKSVITLTDTKGNKLYVANTGEPYPVRLESANGDKIDIVEVGASATITAPSAAEVVDIEQFVK